MVADLCFIVCRYCFFHLPTVCKRSCGNLHCFPGYDFKGMLPLKFRSLGWTVCYFCVVRRCVLFSRRECVITQKYGWGICQFSITSIRVALDSDVHISSFLFHPLYEYGA